MSSTDDAQLRRELEKAAVAASADVRISSQANEVLARLADGMPRTLRTTYADGVLAVSPTDDGDPVVITFREEGFMVDRQGREGWIQPVELDAQGILRPAGEPKEDLALAVAKLITRMLGAKEDFSTFV